MMEAVFEGGEVVEISPGDEEFLFFIFFLS